MTPEEYETLKGMDTRLKNYEDIQECIDSITEVLAWKEEYYCLMLTFVRACPLTGRFKEESVKFKSATIDPSGAPLTGLSRQRIQALLEGALEHLKAQQARI